MEAANIASGLQGGTVSTPSAMQVEVKDTSIVKLLPDDWRQPYPTESKSGALFFGILSLICFMTLNYPEIRKNYEFLPATCEPFSQGVLHPEVRPYRHCSQSCIGCYQSWNPVPCSSKMSMHRSINQYDLEASWHIAGTCGGSSCCAKEVCQRCTKHETRCSRRLSLVWVEDLLNASRADEADEAGEAHDQNEVVDELADEDPMLEAAAALDGTTPSMSSLRRRLDGCMTVTRTYDCNCQCVQRVFSRACTIKCVPYWRSFVPIRVSTYHPAPGFYANAHDASVAQALTDYRALLSVNATSAAVQQAAINRSDAAKSVEVATTYTPPGFAGTSGATVMEGFSRVVTLVFQHGASQSAAMRNLDQPHFAPGAVSECYYDPHWQLAAAMIPRTQLYFSHEMGWSLWKWFLLLLLLIGTGTCVALLRHPGLLGGAVVIDSVHVVHSNIAVIKDTTMTTSMY